MHADLDELFDENHDQLNFHAHHRGHVHFRDHGHARDAHQHHHYHLENLLDVYMPFPPNGILKDLFWLLIGVLCLLVTSTLISRSGIDTAHEQVGVTKEIV